jgi:hypothetical protein
VPSHSEVKRVYDVCQYMFSGEGEYVSDMHYIFKALITPPQLHSELSAEECHPALGR